MVIRPYSRSVKFKSALEWCEWRRGGGYHEGGVSQGGGHHEGGVSRGGGGITMWKVEIRGPN